MGNPCASRRQPAMVAGGDRKRQFRALRIALTPHRHGVRRPIRAGGFHAFIRRTLVTPDPARRPDERLRQRDAGKYVTVFRMVNGEWKIVVDTYTSDLPIPGM